MSSPSNRRRRGFKAFIPYEDVKQHIPKTLFGSYVDDFEEGWTEAQKHWEAQEKKRIIEQEMQDDIVWRLRNPDGYDAEELMREAADMIESLS